MGSTFAGHIMPGCFIILWCVCQTLIICSRYYRAVLSTSCRRNTIDVESRRKRSLNPVVAQPYRYRNSLSDFPISHSLAFIVLPILDFVFNSGSEHRLNGWAETGVSADNWQHLAIMFVGGSIRSYRPVDATGCTASGRLRLYFVAVNFCCRSDDHVFSHARQNRA